MEGYYTIQQADLDRHPELTVKAGDEVEWGSLWVWRGAERERWPRDIGQDKPKGIVFGEK